MQTETLILLVRHGVTQWNYDGRAQGHTDIALAPEGRRQAELAAERLSGESWDALYSSPLVRARDTAVAIAKRIGIAEVRFDDRLKERSMGQAEGSLPTDRPLRWPGLHLMQIPDVESNENLIARGNEVFTDLAGRHPGGRIICVAHGALIHNFLRSLLPPEVAPLHSFNQRNTSMTPVRFNGTRFEQIGPSDFGHIMVDGVEFTGEKGRVRASHLTGLISDRFADAIPDSVIFNATAVESAWINDGLVAFARCFTDGVLYGYVDLAVALPGCEHLVARLIARLQARYPDVSFSQVPGVLQERSGD